MITFVEETGDASRQFVSRITNSCKSVSEITTGIAVRRMRLESQEQRSSEVWLAAPWFVPSPRYFAKLKLTG